MAWESGRLPAPQRPAKGESPLKELDYEAPATLAAAQELLERAGRSARPLAGGTDLIVQLREGLRESNLVVDLKRVPELSGVTYDPEGGLVIGAATSCAVLCESGVLRDHYPGLLDAASLIGSIQIQNRASLGGNLCNGSPAADGVPPLIVLGAQCRILGPSGMRTVPVESFCIGPGKTVLAPGELLVSFHLPPPAPRSGAFYLRFIPRGEMDIAVAGAAASLTLSKDGKRIDAARIAIGAVAPTPLLVAEAGAALVGKVPGDEPFAAAAALARKAARPITDTRGTAEHRLQLVEVLVRRALRGAQERAQQA